MAAEQSTADDDPTLRVLASEFAIYRGRAQHRPTYDTGRKSNDGTGADAEPAQRRGAELGAPTNEFVSEWTDEGLAVTFEDLR